MVPSVRVNNTQLKDTFITVGFTTEAAEKLVTSEDINSLDTLRSLNSTQVKDVVKAIRSLGEPDIGINVSEKAKHNMFMASYVYHIWDHCLRAFKDVSGIVVATELFEQAEMQHKREEAWDNKQCNFDAVTEAEMKNNFSRLYEELVSRLDSVRGLSKNPLSYVVR